MTEKKTRIEALLKFVDVIRSLVESIIKRREMYRTYQQKRWNREINRMWETCKKIEMEKDASRKLKQLGDR